MKHTNKELTEIYSSNKGDNIHAEYFIKTYEISYDEFEIDQDWEDENESVEEHTLNYCLEFYLPIFLKYLKNGHNPIWANEIALSSDDEPRAILDTYHKIKKENPALVKSEIALYAKSISDEELFIKYYLFLMEHDYLIDVEERAFNYVKIFKEEIARGKSEIYAHEYADYRVGSEDFTDKYCECYAFGYEKAIKDGKPEEYSRIFADCFGTFGCGDFHDLLKLEDGIDLMLLENTLAEMNKK